MIAPSRGFASAVCSLQCRRLASSSSRAPRPPRKQPPPPPRAPKPYKPTARRPEPSSSSSPPPPPRPPPQSDTLLTLWRRSWLPLSGAALVAGCVGYYLVGTAAATLGTLPTTATPCRHHRDGGATPTGRPPALTGENAEQFDRDLDGPEWWMGIASLRRRLAQRARGHVLEVAVGTGRNLAHYNWAPLCAAVEGRRPAPGCTGLASFTGLDISVDMLDVARKCLVRAVPPMASSAALVSASTMADHTGGQLSFLGGHLRLINSDAHRPLPPSPARDSGGKYDTIVQTFGLCSVSDPVAVIANLACAVKPGTGRIFLLEHGQGWYGLVNGLLDKYAGQHFDKYGCWWNRDIEGLVDEAVKKTPGLETVDLHRPKFWQFGTLVWVELRVNPEARAS